MKGDNLQTDMESITQRLPPAFLKGKNIILSPLNSEHINLYFRWQNDADIRIYFGNSIPLSRALIEESVRKTDHTSINFEIWHIEDAKPVGIAKISSINWIRRKCSIGGLIGEKSYWGRGLATELTQLLIDYIFGELNLNKIVALVYSLNKGSQICAERCGFQLEATIKDAGYFNGEYCSDYYYSLHQSEWRKRRARNKK